MPPREGRRKKVKHQVHKNIRCLQEIDDFLKAALKFSKKFYKISLRGGEDHPYRLTVEAIAISRDLIYSITWGMDAKAHDIEETEDYEELVYKGNAPIHKWIPKNEKDLKKLYPNIGQVPDKPGKHYWMTLFGCWDYIKVDRITVVD